MEKSIIIISSCVFPANPDYYGSEWLNSLLADELVEMGYNVHLIAPPKSETKAELHPIPGGYGELNPHNEYKAYEGYKDLLLSADYVIDWSATVLPSSHLWFWHREEMPTTVFARNGTDFSRPFPPVNQELPCVVLSQTAKKIAHKAGIPERNIHIIPYGLPLDVYKPAEDPREEYFLYLSRPHTDKGLHRFLNLADTYEEKDFVMAFSMDTEEHKKHGEKALEYAEDLGNVEYVPSPDLEKKIELYQHAKALVIPLAEDYVEAFGLVFVEAMACGTPVITADHGSVREVVKDGKTGFRCSDMLDYEWAVKNIDQIERRDCREWVEMKYSAGRMAKNYIQLYEFLQGK